MPTAESGMPLVAVGEAPRVAGGLPLIAQNTQLGASAGLALRAVGLGQLNGGIPAGDGMPMAVARDPAGAVWLTAIGPGEAAAGGLPLLAAGHSPMAGGLPLVVPSGHGVTPAALPLFAHGY